MSDNKKYYYIKLKDHYFEQDNIKILEAQENGYIYSLIILKLYLKSTQYEGRLMMTDKIPYDPDKLSILSKVLNHDIAHIKDALSYAVDLDLISIMDSGEIWMTEIQNMIGQSSSEADRKRKYRQKLEDMSQKGQMSGQMSRKKLENMGQMSGQSEDKYPPEKEIELESKRERKLKKEKESDLAKNTDLSDPKKPSMYKIIESIFLSKNNDNFDNYKKEGMAIKGIITKAEKRENTNTFIQELIEKFYDLTINGNDFWTEQPFLPSALNASGIFARVEKQIQVEEFIPTMPEYENMEDIIF